MTPATLSLLTASLSLIALPAAAKTQDVGRFEVFEHDIRQPSGPYANVWNDVVIAVTLVAPSGRTHSIGGFYFDTDLWKFRFAPDELGTWQWSYRFDARGTGTVRTDSGTFECVPSANRGFIRPDPSAPHLWTCEQGGRFQIFGLQDCLDEDLTTRYGIGNGQRRLFPDYIKTYADAGFNTWRLNVRNCSFSVYTNISPQGNTFDAAQLRAFDRYARWVREAGMRIYLVLFGFSVPNGMSSPNSAEMDAVRAYLTHMVDRYGAYVDWWEIANEVGTAQYSENWLKQVTAHVRSVDPYQHAISMSWQRPAVTEIDIDSPHRYLSPSMTGVADAWARDIAAQRVWGKPIVYGEVGNKLCNNEPETAFRWRVTSWLALFEGASLIYWNTANANYCNGVASNVSMDREFRDNMRMHGDFLRDLDATARPDPVTVSDPGVLAWALDGQRDYAVYLFADDDPYSTRSGLTIAVDASTGGTGQWIRPVDGTVVASVTLPAGPTTVPVPDFSGDLLLDVTAGPVCQQNLGGGGPGNATLSVCGQPLGTGGTARIQVDGGVPMAAAWLLTSTASNPTSVLGATVFPYPVQTVLSLRLNARGRFARRVRGGGGPGSMHVQVLYLDPARPAGFGLTNAVNIGLLP